VIYVPGKLLFIHIPRTGGTSVKNAIQAFFPDATRDDSHRKHWTARDHASCMTIAEWERCERFTVLRNPHDLIASDWRYCRDSARRATMGDLGFHPVWCAKLRRTVNADFPRFVRDEWLGQYSPLYLGGFRRTWCSGLSGEDYGVRVLRFEHLADDWLDLCNRLGITRTELPVANSSEPSAVEWPSDLSRRVAECCWMDLM